MTKKKKPVFISPKGEVAWPHLRTPDMFFVKRSTDAGKYNLTLVLDPEDEEVTAFADAVKSWAQKAGVPGLPFKLENGRLRVRFSTLYPPPVFDSKRNLIPQDVEIGSGSIAKVAYSANKYDGFGGGINLYLNGVQVLEYVPYTGRDAESLGFGEEEGFVPDPNTPKEEPDDADNLPF